MARQRPVRLGAILGNDYVVLDGIKPGDRLIVSGAQNLVGRHARGSRARPDRPWTATRSSGFVDFFIRRPVLATVCSLFIVIAGAVVIPTLPVAQYPQLAPPQVTVSSFYTGANAQTVESAVTTPLEQAINGVEGMRYMTSSSGNDGSSQITVTFDLTRNLDLAAVDVQNRVSTVTGRLPNEVKTTGSSSARTSASSSWRPASTPRTTSTTTSSSATTSTSTSRTRSSAFPASAT